MRSWVDETAFSSDTNGSQWVVTGDHTADEVGRSQSLNSRSRPGLELVLKYDEAEEAQPGFGLFTASGHECTQIFTSLYALTVSFSEPSTTIALRYSSQPWQ